MTDIEKQKAAALCDYCQTPVNTSACPRCSKPSPRVSDSEVDAAIEMCSREEIYHTIKNTLGDRFLKPFMTLKLYAKKCAAQHPQREEWLDISSAPRDGSPILSCVAGRDEAVICWWGEAEGATGIKKMGWKTLNGYYAIFGCAVEPTHWQPLPSPPKAEK